MSQTVIGIFDNENEAQQAVQNLVNRGFDKEDVDIAARSYTGTNVNNNDDDNSFGHSISNFFGSLFGSDDDNTSKYSEVAKRGVTVTVHTHSDDEAERAADLLDECGAVNVDEKASEYRSNSGAGFSNSDSDKTHLSGSNFSDKTSDMERKDDTSALSIPIIDEQLTVDKKQVESGGARIRSRIVEKPVEESVRLRTERVNIERNPVNREATDADFNTFKEGTVEMTEHKEVPVVEKKAWVKEEVSLNKNVEEPEETIRDSVRSTEVDVENLKENDQHENAHLSSNTDKDDDNDELNDTHFDRNKDRSI